MYKQFMQTFIVAELSANHLGDFDLTKQLIVSAKDAGADAVKLQTYTADSMTIDCDAADFVIKGSGQWDGRRLYDLYREAAMPWEWQRELKRFADEVGIELFSSPFDRASVDFLDGIGVGRFKIASFEATDTPFIRYVASKGKPVIVSAGILSPDGIQAVIDACHAEGNHDVTVLKCTSAYPAPPESMNLATVEDMIERYGHQGVKIGLSDHTTTAEAAIVAVALGATIVEKHFILDRALGGPDAAFSANPAEFKAMVESVRKAERMRGRVDYSANPAALAYARSLYVCEDVIKGEVFTERNLRSIRPGGGCSPALLPELLGHKAACDLVRGTPMKTEYAIDT